MTISPMPPPPNATVQVYLPRAAYDRITPDDVKAAAGRVGYTGPLRWESSTHKMPGYAPSGAVRLTCKVGIALALLDCFRVLSTSQEADVAAVSGIAFKILSDGIDAALRQKFK